MIRSPRYSAAADIIISLTDWFCFLVLDLGNPTIMSIPTGVRVVIGTLQACAVRAAGFAIVNLAALAPAVQYVHGPTLLHIFTDGVYVFTRVLYVIMMYISVCESSSILLVRVRFKFPPRSCRHEVSLSSLSSNAWISRGVQCPFHQRL